MGTIEHKFLEKRRNAGDIEAFLPGIQRFCVTSFDRTNYCYHFSVWFRNAATTDMSKKRIKKNRSSFIIHHSSKLAHAHCCFGTDTGIEGQVSQTVEVPDHGYVVCV